MSPFPDGSGMADETFTSTQAANAALLQEAGTGSGSGAIPTPADGVGFPPGLGPHQDDVRSDLSAAGMPDYLSNASSYVPAPETPGIDQPELHLAQGDKTRKPPNLRQASGDPDKDNDVDACAGCVHFGANKCKLYNGFPVRPNQVCDSFKDKDAVNAGDPADGDALDLAALAQEMGIQLADDNLKVKCPKCDTLNAVKGSRKCKNCGHDLTDAIKAKMANMSQPQEHLAKIYQDLGEGLRLAVEHDGLVWKVACKTGTLALSPGPGQVDVEKPLVLSDDLFNDMVLSAKERAFPYITVPETHANGSLENTGYVRDQVVLDQAQALQDPRIGDKGKEQIKHDPSDTRYLLAGIDFTDPKAREKAENGSIPDCSIGVKFNYRNKRSGKLFKAAWEHLALTPVPWVDGLPAFGMSQQGGVFDADEQMDRYDGVYIDAPEASAGDEIDLAVVGQWWIDFEGAGLQLAAANISKDQRDKWAQQGIALSDGSFPIPNVDFLKRALRAIGRAGEDKVAKVKAHIRKRAKALGAEATLKDSSVFASAPHGSQDGDTPAGDTLREDERDDTILDTLSASAATSEDNMTDTPTTVEELLAAQQVEAERQAVRIRELESSLQLAQGTISSQGEQLHTENVKARVQQLNGKLPPAVLLAAEQIWLADKPTTGDEGGLQLSVQVPKSDGEGLEQKDFKSPSEIVDFMLSAMPTGDEGVALYASVRNGLAGLQLAEHEDAQSDEAKRSQVDAWEREHHPERFKDNGTGERIV